MFFPARLSLVAVPVVIAVLMFAALSPRFRVAPNNLGMVVLGRVVEIHVYRWRISDKRARRFRAADPRIAVAIKILMMPVAIVNFVARIIYIVIGIGERDGAADVAASA